MNSNKYRNRGLGICELGPNLW